VGSVTRPSFSADDRTVYWGPAAISAPVCEALLDMFDAEGALDAWVDLHACHVFAGGVPRVSSLRRAA
jgi:hypothetical protein